MWFGNICAGWEFQWKCSTQGTSKLNQDDLGYWTRDSTLLWVWSTSGVRLRVWKEWFLSYSEQWEEMPLNIVLVLCWSLACWIHRCCLLLLPLWGSLEGCSAEFITQCSVFSDHGENYLFMCRVVCAYVFIFVPGLKCLHAHRLWAKVLSQTLESMFPLTCFQNTPFACRNR